MLFLHPGFSDFHKSCQKKQNTGSQKDQPGSQKAPKQTKNPGDQADARQNAVKQPRRHMRISGILHVSQTADRILNLTFCF